MQQVSECKKLFCYKGTYTELTVFKVHKNRRKNDMD